IGINMREGSARRLLHLREVEPFIGLWNLVAVRVFPIKGLAAEAVGVQCLSQLRTLYQVEAIEGRPQHRCAFAAEVKCNSQPRLHRIPASQVRRLREAARRKQLREVSLRALLRRVECTEVLKT